MLRQIHFFEVFFVNWMHQYNQSQKIFSEFFIFVYLFCITNKDVIA